MPTKPKRSIAQQLNTAQVVISNSLADAEIRALVAGYGYAADRLNEGKQLYDNALNTINLQTAAAGAQQQATATLVAAQKAARGAYQALAQVARATWIKDKTRLVALGLTGTMPRDTAGFLANAYTLFNNATAAPGLATYGYDQAKLNSERAKIAAFDSANQAQEAAKGTAQQATREQVAALRTLNEWTAHYLKIARVALRDKPQLLEKLGIAARTTKTKAQRAAPTKAAATRAAKKKA